MNHLGYYLGLPPAAIFATVVSTIVMYTAIVVLLRTSGQRLFASPSSFDLAVVTVLGAIVGRATMGMTPTLGGAIIALTTLLACEFVVGRVRRTARRGAQGHRAVAVVVAGKADRDMLRRYRVPDTSLWTALRAAGVSSPRQVALAVLEPNGRFSVIRTGVELHEAVLTGVRNSQTVRGRLIDAGLLTPDKARPTEGEAEPLPS